jgi:SulP family sulfate permease
LLAFGTTALLVALKRFVPILPGALVAVLVGVAAQVLLDLDDRGVALVDRIPKGLPTPALPSFENTGTLFPAALGIALICAIESISVARSFKRSDDPRLNPNREWLALGAANLGAAFLKGFPAGGGTSQTAVNARAGARSGRAGLVTAAVVVLSLTLLAAFFSNMPEATLGAIVLVAAIGLVQPREFRRIRAIRFRDWVLALAATAAVLFLGALQGMLVAVLLSMLTLLYEADHPRISELGRRRGTDDFRPLDQHPEDERFEGLRIVRPEGILYFANADRVHDQLLELASEPGTRVLLIDGRAMPDLEFSGLESMLALVGELEERGVGVWVAALNPRPFDMLTAHEVTRVLLFPTVREAVQEYVARGEVLHRSDGLG